MALLCSLGALSPQAILSTAHAETAPVARPVAPTAPAAEPPGALQRVFWYGPSFGTPSAGKSVLVFTLYGLGVGGAAFGGIYLNETVRARLATDRFITRAEGAAPCFDRASPGCQKLTELRAAENTTSHLALLGAAGAGACLLTGLISAFLWENEANPPALQAFPLTLPSGGHAVLAGAQFTVRARF